MITNNLTKIGTSLLILSMFLFGISYWHNNSVNKTNEESGLLKVTLEKPQDDKCAMDAEVLRVENGIFECAVDANGNPIRWILQGYDD